VNKFRTPAASVDEGLAAIRSPEPPLLVDTRRTVEFEASHLPGAILWRAGEGQPMPQALEQAGREEKPVLFYCSIGYRSGAAGDQFLERFPGAPARNLEGGAFLWAERGGPLEGGSLVHPYDAEWGQLLRPDLRAPLDPRE
jgi:rhodanese-related sulfurtransferase